MKAVVSTKYGPPGVLELTEVEKPVPEDDEVLVKVHAASVNPADWHLLRGEPYVARLQLGLRKPKEKVLGCDVAGQVEAVGENAEMLRPGDEVFGSPFMHGFGAFAEYVCVSEDLLAPKPANLSFEQAAAVPLAASTALQGRRGGQGHGSSLLEREVGRFGCQEVFRDTYVLCKRAKPVHEWAPEHLIAWLEHRDVLANRFDPP